MIKPLIFKKMCVKLLDTRKPDKVGVHSGKSDCLVLKKPWCFMDIWTKVAKTSCSSRAIPKLRPYLDSACLKTPINLLVDHIDGLEFS